MIVIRNDNQEIPLKKKVMKNNFLWGVRFSVEDAYSSILNRDENFDFFFNRLFENEEVAVIYKNLGIVELLKLEDKLDILKPNIQEKWIVLFETYKEQKDKILRRENENNNT